MNGTRSWMKIPKNEFCNRGFTSSARTNKCGDLLWLKINTKIMKNHLSFMVAKINIVKSNWSSFWLEYFSFNQIGHAWSWSKKIPQSRYLRDILGEILVKSHAINDYFFKISKCNGNRDDCSQTELPREIGFCSDSDECKMKKKYSSFRATKKKRHPYILTSITLYHLTTCIDRKSVV